MLTAAYLGATAVACVFVPPLGGAMLGAYVGSLTANGGQLNMGKWNYQSSETWLSIGFGAAFGGLAGYGLANPGSVSVKCRWLVRGVGALGFNFDEDISFQWETNAGGSGEITKTVVLTSTPWMDYASSQIGQSEWTDGKNPQITRYFESTGIKSDQSDPWCAAFVHWSLAQSNIVGAGINGYAYKDWGRPITDPIYGAITIFKTGHVGFYVGNNGSNLIIIHGNWSNRVDRSDYITPDQIQEYRFPLGY